MSQTRIYIAGPWSWRRYLRGFAKIVDALPGYDVVSRWLDDDSEQSNLFVPGEDGGLQVVADEDQRRILRAAARRDLDDLSVCDELVLFTGRSNGYAGSMTHGRSVEFGFVLGMQIDSVIVVGEPDSIFHLLGGYDNTSVIAVETEEDALRLLRAASDVTSKWYGMREAVS